MPRACELEQRLSFPDAFAKAFQEDVARLDDQDAYAADQWLQTAARQLSRDPAKNARPAADQGQHRHGRRGGIDVGVCRLRGVSRLRSADRAARGGGWTPPLLGRGSRGAGRAEGRTSRPSSCARKTPPTPCRHCSSSRSISREDYARESAARGYAGVVAYARRDADASRGSVPFEHDGEDAREVINWIAKQPWSDGRVGMYGEGYSGFTPWAAAKRPPAALKAIATAAASAPGIDLPMQGNIFQNSGYRWSLHVVDPDALGDAAYRRRGLVAGVRRKVVPRAEAGTAIWAACSAIPIRCSSAG